MCQVENIDTNDKGFWKRFYFISYSSKEMKSFKMYKHVLYTSSHERKRKKKSEKTFQLEKCQCSNHYQDCWLSSACFFSHACGVIVFIWNAWIDCNSSSRTVFTNLKMRKKNVLFISLIKVSWYKETSIEFWNLDYHLQWFLQPTCTRIFVQATLTFCNISDFWFLWILPLQSSANVCV